MTYQLCIEPLGQTIAVGEGQTILDACLRAGVYLPHACGHGLCGSCKIAVLEGEVEHNDASSFALMDFERDEGKALACVATIAADTVIEADMDDEPDAQHHPVRDYRAVVSRTEALSPDILGLWLRLAEGALPFQAGQYVMLSVPGVEGARAFSVASAPSQGEEIELHIRRVPGGKATGWLHDHAAPGVELALAGPYGRFHVRGSAGLPKLFLAGGSGLSSPQSMILDLLERGDPHPILLVHGARDAAGLYHADLFRELEARHAHFAYLPVVSGDDPGWAGERGHVHEVIERRFGGRFDGHQAYLCGPPVMIDACITTLMRGRLFERQIFHEKFLTPADAQQARSPLFKRI